MTKRTPLFIAAIAVMLMAATTTQAYYCEQWSSLLGAGDGSITLNDTIYYADDAGGYAWCVEDGAESNECLSGYDYFLPEYTSWWAQFVTDDDRDTLYLTSTTYSTHKNEGCKETGQSGTKEGTGYWCGYDSAKGIYIWGTWDTGDQNDSKYFNYTPNPPTVSGDWAVSGASSGTASGSGSGSGTQQSNIPNCGY